MISRFEGREVAEGRARGGSRGATRGRCPDQGTLLARSPVNISPLTGLVVIGPGAPHPLLCGFTEGAWSVAAVEAASRLKASLMDDAGLTFEKVRAPASARMVGDLVKRAGPTDQ